MQVQLTMAGFTEQGLFRSIELFNHPEECSNKRLVLLGIRFLLQYHDRISYRVVPTKPRILDHLKSLIEDHRKKGTFEGNGVLMEILDILNDFFPDETQELMDFIRDNRLVANNDSLGVHTTAPECTVYENSQLTHNKYLNESVRKASKYLVENFSPKFSNDAAGEKERILHYEKIYEFLVSKFGENLIPVLDQIYRDNSIHVTVGHTTGEVLIALMSWIEINSKNSKDFPVKIILDRLKEELIEARNYCSSRLLSGIINSIQGFSSDENLMVRISDREQVKSVIYNHLNRAIQNSGDEDIMDQMLNGGPKFVAFVKAEVSKNIETWAREYGDGFVSHTIEVVNAYAKNIMIYE